jgi:hypothetical protein
MTGIPNRSLVVLPLVVALLAVLAERHDAAQTAVPLKTYITFADARPTFTTLYQDWPVALRGLDERALEAAWPDWVRQRDGEIRARLERGDEDSVVNLWLYGTSFTRRPRAIERAAQAGDPESSDAAAAGRLEDLLDAMVRPGDNERLLFARDLFERRGPQVASADGRRRIRTALQTARRRASDEQRAYARQLASTETTRDPGKALAVHATLYRDRGLSSDTSVLIGFAVEQALRGMMETATLATGRVRRVGIIGPGLDFTNKADGQDFYPLQTIQPFALLDALLRLGLADARGVQVTAFDVNPRVAAHLERSRARATAGEGYPLHLPIGDADRWRPELLAFWKAFGDRIADPATPVKAPAAAGTGPIRAVRVRPSVVQSIEVRDLNAILERPASNTPDDRFDLLVATNVLVYYDRFEQSLAMANAAAMLRPGGVLLTNNAVFPTPPFKPEAHHLFVTYSDRQSEHVFWYERE